MKQVTPAQFIQMIAPRVRAVLCESRLNDGIWVISKKSPSPIHIPYEVIAKTLNIQVTVSKAVQ